MVQDKSINLTPEEQGEIAQSLPILLQAIESGSPIASAWLAQWRSNRSVAEEAREQAEEIQREVTAAIKTEGPEQAHMAQWCGFPTDMTRCSPFFPMNVRELGHREFLQDFVITSANWGEIKYTGPKLSTYEEDALLVLLAILDGQNKHRQITELEGRKTYTYKGPLLPLLKLLGYARPSKKDYKRLISALELMTVAGVKLAISAGKTKTGKRRGPRLTQMSAILAAVRWDDQSKEIMVTINPFFYETYMDGRVTLLDVAKRIKMKGVITKALYRFVQSQRQSPVFVGHYLTLADALNMNREQPTKNTKKFLKAAIQELIRCNVLMKQSGFIDTDIIKMNRTINALPKQEKNNNK